MAKPPIFASPALPTELLRYVVHHCVYPTTLVVCSSQEDFLSCLAQDIASPSALPLGDQSPNPSPALLTASLQQLSVAKHIQTVFVPTVSHLRAYTSVFPVGIHKVPPPPSGASRNPRLIVYGFLDIHRESSEWSAQALSNSAAILVEAAKDLDFQATIIEPQRSGEEVTSSAALLGEVLPVLAGSAKKDENGEWIGRAVDVRGVLGRWFRFQDVTWKR